MIYDKIIRPTSRSENRFPVSPPPPQRGRRNGHPIDPVAWAAALEILG